MTVANSPRPAAPPRGAPRRLQRTSSRFRAASGAWPATQGDPPDVSAPARRLFSLGTGGEAPLRFRRLPDPACEARLRHTMPSHQHSTPCAGPANVRDGLGAAAANHAPNPKLRRRTDRSSISVPRGARSASPSERTCRPCGAAAIGCGSTAAVASFADRGSRLHGDLARCHRPRPASNASNAIGNLTEAAACETASSVARRAPRE